MITADATRYSGLKESISFAAIARFFVYLALFSLMFNNHVVNASLYIAVSLTLMVNTWWYDLKRLVQPHLIWASVLLLGVLALGLFYSQTSWHDSLGYGSKYLKIMYLLVLMPLFQGSASRRYALGSWLLGVFAAELVMYLHYFDIVNFGYLASKHWLFVNDIDAGYLVTFAAFVLLNYILDHRQYRGLACLLLLPLCTDILFLNQERSAYLVFLGLLGLSLWQRGKKLGLGLAILIVPLMFATLYVGSHKFQDRVNEVTSDVRDYQHGNETTSVGLRLAFAKYSYDVIKKSPTLGAGTGSFPLIYRQMGGPKIDETTWPSHPHNEYIAILFQVGTLGLLVFSAWIMLQLRAASQLPDREKKLAQGLILGFILLSLCNATLPLNPTGSFYVVFLAIFLAAGSATYRRY